MSKVIVLGAGMVGSAIAIDMAKKHDVTVTDLNQNILSKVNLRCKSLNTAVLDVTDKLKLKDIISQFDLVICAVPGFLGFETLKSIIEAQKNVIDISFFPKIHSI